MNRRGDGDGEGDEPGKMFVGGITSDTVDDDLKSYFKQYGEITDVHVMMDSQTMRSRCFGFVTFNDPASVDLVIASKPHELKGKTIDPKQCNKKAAAAARAKKNDSNDRSMKVFVGGLPATCGGDDLKAFFSDFGEVTESVIVIDPETKHTRGFGFVTFQSQDSVDKVVKLRYHNLQGKQVECKAAQPRLPGMSRPSNSNQSTNQWNPQGYPPADGWPPYGGPPAGNWSHSGYDAGYGGVPPYGQPMQPGYGQPNPAYPQYPPAAGYGNPPYDYTGMGGSYGQQQSSYGPERGAYNPQGQYGGAQPNAYGSGYPDAASGYPAPAAYGGQMPADPRYPGPAPQGPARGYHPYGR